MSTKVFLDTNIFVYCFDSASPPKREIANGLVRDAHRTRAGVISYQVVQEFFNVALSRFAQPFSTADAEQYLTSAMLPLLSIHSSPALYSKALHLKNKYCFSWYDSLIVAAAADGGCEKLLTEDLQHGMRIGEMRIENPFLAH